MPAIRGDRLLDDLRTLARFGGLAPGVDRIALSADDLAARRWLVDRLAAAGLDAGMDRLGNVLGRDPRAARAILVGSHSDTVPRGGWLDGAMGVIYGLEIARAFREAGGGPVGIDVVSFQDEEGTYLPFLGSRAFCGTLKDGEIDAARAEDGRTLADALAPLAGEPAPFRLDPTRHVAFLEAHIEQGPRLEASGQKIGVVTGITGIRRFRITATGAANHAGTTPMGMRRDAGAALVRLAAWIGETFPALGGPETVWNIGAMTFRPGAANVVPGEAEMAVEMRDLDVAILDRMEAALAERVAGESRDGVAIAMVRTTLVAPTVMGREIVAALSAAAVAAGHPPVLLPSGAGHDAMEVGRVLPAGMLFVPSIGGISHHVAENTADADIVLGCQVLADAISRLMQNLA
ncbi:M20 family metallo-hydrolase [Rhodoplanes sp. TEM]|uniref:M20 family metallo-hydrolase n=1 Tax=Rhodoplanes tepidamans TaxID=200616 RepID=A0ABT5JL40_RHOTP|nr:MULTISPECIES: M20 family metallo-hydrolase [Rhodoplanes]MDC7789978.1 M20 family metallo-hydrolase [Rhodoplanes tepidamans]MDC7985363.1 M20 family metallo-hydrolase [Rhodoplanes sp. TEM]MDQ0359246.1 N-carbamoyl-L-amino-acid hydrolase [Rhodoplanes tepidamans]